MKVAVIGIGYVGLANALLLSKRYEVSCFDIDLDKVDKLNNKISPLDDDSFIKAISKSNNRLSATNKLGECIKDASYALVCVPTNLDTKTNRLDMSIVESVVKDITKLSNDICIVIKSTLRVGTTESLIKDNNNTNIIFSPEFLREKYALEDIKHPSRVVLGFDLNNDKVSKSVTVFANILKSICKVDSKKIIYLRSDEAESVKLFSNAYLAMRLTYFNEVDKYYKSKGQDSSKVIDTICLDNRIGNLYNVPNGVIGGKCLPKDIKELSKETGSNLLNSVIECNK